MATWIDAIGKGVRGIGGEAFLDCTALKDITIGRSAAGLGYGIFKGCKDLTIHAEEGSKIYTHAKEEKIKVIAE